MPLYKFNEKQFTELEQTNFAKENILERKDLQNALKNKISILDKDLLVIAEEYNAWEDINRRIDLLAIDTNANLVVIELKRTETGDHMELQALRYAAMVSTLTYNKAIEVYDRYLKSINSESDAEEEILNHIEDKGVSNFGNDTKIILVAQDFSKEITTSVLWLNERDLDIKCFKWVPYKLNGQLLIDVQQIIPLPEAEDYLVKTKERKETIKASKKDYTKYIFNGQSSLSKCALVLAVWKDYLQKNTNLTLEKINKDFPKALWFMTKEKALSYKNKDSGRRFFNDDDATVIIDGQEYVVSNQWGKFNINQFIEYAEKIGYKIDIDTN